MRWNWLLAIVLLVHPLAHSAIAQARPNIIFLMADDMGWADAGCYGQKEIKTPSIDRLATEGTRFTNVYAGASVCAPSRCVLMTGKHLGHARVRGNAGMVGGIGTERRVPLEPVDVTVAMLLQQVGYATGIAGKWGLAEPETNGIPNKKGFDQWFGYLNQNHAAIYYTDYLWHNTQRFTLEGNLNGQTGQYSHDVIAEWSLDFVRKNKDKPFFLYLPWTLPHAEYVVPSLETYGDKQWPHEFKVHAAMVTRLDRDLGRLMTLLKELGLEKNTLVFFCSDNGGVQRRDGVLDSVGPFRGKKGTQYEGGLRVPMIVRWPNHVAASAVSHVAWYYADVLPTLCDVAGIKPPADIDGLSVLPSLQGQVQAELQSRMLYWEQYNGGFQQAVRWGNWKGHYHTAGNRFELYDLSADQLEEHNVAPHKPDVVGAMRAFMAASHVPSANWPVTAANDSAKKPKTQKKR